MLGGTLRARTFLSEHERAHGYPDDCLGQFGAALDERLRLFFAYLGDAVARKPWSFLGLAVLITALCSSGYLGSSVALSCIRYGTYAVQITVSDPAQLVTPSTAHSFSDQSSVTQAFGFPARRNFIFGDLGGSNVLSQASLLALLQVYQSLLSTTATVNNKTYTFQSVFSFSSCSYAELRAAMRAAVLRAGRSDVFCVVGAGLLAVRSGAHSQRH